jgi:phosphate transport system permease protein
MSETTATAGPIVAPAPPRSDYLPDAAARRRLRRWRSAKDGLARGTVGLGGISVIVALGLIFVYLLSEVMPLLRPASVALVASYDSPGNSAADTLGVFGERYHQVAVRFADDGSVVFFRPQDGTVLREDRLPIPDGVAITSFARGEPRTGLIAVGLSDGTAILARHEYRLTYPEGRLTVVPELALPFAAGPLTVDPDGAPIEQIGVQGGPDGAVVAAQLADGRIQLVRYRTRTNMMTGQTTVEESIHEIDAPDHTITRVLISMDLRDLFLSDEAGAVHYYDIANPANARLVDSAAVIGADQEVTAMEFLLGTVSLIVGGADGSISQWFLVRDNRNVRRLVRVRNFAAHEAPVTAINPEYARKGFLTADAQGHLAIHYSTSERTVLSQRLLQDAAIDYVMPTPRANGALVLDDANRIHFLSVDNRHPEVSLKALWGRVWYEGRTGPTHTWQSSSATDEFEPKFSLVPLTVGTLKAAFYAMLFAMPLAIAGAIFTAYFMAPRMRSVTKPAIEIMEALPTVILGFLAGLWMAPFVESHLPAVFSVLLLLPLGMLLTAFLWSRIPARLRQRVAGGWEAAILVPVVLLVGWLCVTTSPYLELLLFSGDMRQWLTDQGIAYDQRNALVVGFAMGFAVIPTIFSIAEDALFNVPKHLTYGPMALGATRWQTLTRVVLRTASPGIFSAVMIGLGRAVGETMIVLMATGNSPIINFNIFEGMRVLSANIAVEMPEAAFGGTHFRILFVSALLLFFMTFLFNTLAEIVRQRLRQKYASL